MPEHLTPERVLPPKVTRAVAEARYWFVIGGHAVRCLCPYRPSRDVDFGVERARDLTSLLGLLRKRGRVELLERSKDTVHLAFDGIDVSVFVLPALAAHTEQQALTVTGILATKLHAILDRGTRRDFFDLYVVLERQRFGIVECFRALREVYHTDINEGLLLRAMTYFDDADVEAALPGEGKGDWETVKAFFVSRATTLLLPPDRALRIQSRVVDVQPPRAARVKGTRKLRSRKAAGRRRIE